MKDELTETMHIEFSVSEETDQKHATWTALETIADGTFSKKAALEAYGVTVEDIVKYKKEWEELS